MLSTPVPLALAPDSVLVPRAPLLPRSFRVFSAVLP
jgi:hypothetical protein